MVYSQQQAWATLAPPRFGPCLSIYGKRNTYHSFIFYVEGGGGNHNRSYHAQKKNNRTTVKKKKICTTFHQRVQRGLLINFRKFTQDIHEITWPKFAAIYNVVTYHFYSKYCFFGQCLRHVPSHVPTKGKETILLVTQATRNQLLANNLIFYFKKIIPRGCQQARNKKERLLCWRGTIEERVFFCVVISRQAMETSDLRKKKSIYNNHDKQKQRQTNNNDATFCANINWKDHHTGREGF